MDERVDVGVLVGAAAFKVDDDLLEGRVVIDSLYVSGAVRCVGGDHVQILRASAGRSATYRQRMVSTTLTEFPVLIAIVEHRS